VPGSVNDRITLDMKVCKVCLSVFTRPHRVSFEQWDRRFLCSSRCRSTWNRQKRKSYNLKQSTKDRFWKFVHETNDHNQCWEWQGYKSVEGYGRFQIHNRTHTASKVAWTLTHGPVPEGLCVLHRCDNPPCVNPNHLFLGTVKDNVSDMWEKGRAHWQKNALHMAS